MDSFLQEMVRLEIDNSGHMVMINSGIKMDHGLQEEAEIWGKRLK